MKNSVNWKKLPEEPYKPLAELARRAAAEGCVLLKNEGNILPLGKEDRISLFGRTQIDYNKSGTGSGGMVRVKYAVNILDGILENNKLTLNTDLTEIYKKWIEENPFDKGAGWAKEPWFQKEMIPDEETVAQARASSDVAVIVIGRTAGEDRDNATEKGSWYLTDEEEQLLERVSKYFEKTAVLLNVGNIIDMQWVERYNIKAVMYIWQGGQEGGRACADVLCGDIVPSGRLTDTIAKDIGSYPSMKNFGDRQRNIYEEDIYVGYRYFETFAKDEVLYPFGFGLSYTAFEKKVVKACENNGKICLDISVGNIGAYNGRDTVQIYFSAPQGKLGKSARELAAFSKTELLKPNEKETVHIEFAISDMASYDDGGITGNKSCYVLEEGEYDIYVGDNVRDCQKVYSHTIEKLTVTKRCSEALAPELGFSVMYPEQSDGKLTPEYRRVSVRTTVYKERIKASLPADFEYTGDKGIKLADVKNGKNTMEEFVAQLSDEDLTHIVKGEGMCSPKTRSGNAGAVGGLTPKLRQFGIPVIAMHDGPSGIRMDNGDYATSLPNGTCLACSWDTLLMEGIGELLSVELCTHRIDAILGPGINIHRTPLNGRNFEYYSEDPYLTGKLAAAFIRGVGNYGNSATVKHFMANSQEYSRRSCDAVMSERAAREIYLKGFEIAVKEGKATSLMTSYNPVNGIMAVLNYELNTIVLREEWGFDGFVVSDWWPNIADAQTEELNLCDMVEAQNDVYMPTQDVTTSKDNLKKSLAEGRITRGQLQRSAMNILGFLMNTHAFERLGTDGEFKVRSLADNADSLSTAARLSDIENGKTYEIDLPEVGAYLLCIAYASDAAEITQMTVGISVNGISIDAATVNGNNGGTAVVLREFSVNKKHIRLTLTYPDEQLSIKYAEIKG
ncbi:MAG: glycoside hydrolase family 3 protein [Clostridia bacterium]|nr:glycoside hydrolase family 3 protein [Clostridia bacterium]